MQYFSPSSLGEATRRLAEAEGSAHVLAGGSDLLVRMKSGFIEPDLVIDIKSIKELREIQHSADGFSIGAAVPCIAMGESADLKKAWPGVVEAANLIGSKQIQARCTIAGNLCNASPAADSVPALVAADAKAVIAGLEGERTVDIDNVVVAPGKTSLARGEIVKAITLKQQEQRSADAYLRFIPRTEMDIAVVSAGVNLTIDENGVIVAARVALGAVAPTVVLVENAAEAIVGTKLDDAAAKKLSDACSAACQPIDDKRGTISFRKKVSGVLANRAARIAYERAGGK